MQYRSWRHWNIVMGCTATRLSTSDDRGNEFFVLVRQNQTGKQNKLLRNVALDAIEAHIEMGGEPGEVPFHG